MKRFLPLLLILLMAVPVMAQQARGRITGTVTTSDGAVITDVKVTIASDALIAREMTTMTNERGQFRFVLLPVGTYTLTMEKEGYAKLTEEGIVVDFNETVTVDKTMQASVAGEVITITGEAPIVDKTSSSKGDKLDLEFLQNTPTGNRNVFALPNLSAGFNDDSGFGGVQDAGNAFMIDGVNVSDPSTSTVFTQMNIEAVEQVDVNLFGANAEYGSFTGAALNVITKSGGNEFSGEGYWYAQRVDWVDDNTEEVQQFGITAPTASDIDNFAGSLGGPIIKDKIWFFANYNNTSSTTAINLLDGPNEDVQDQYRAYGKVSARWDDRNISYISYTRHERERSNRTGLGPTSQNLESNQWMQETTNQMFLAQHSIVLTDNLIVEGRYANAPSNFDLIPRQFGPTVIDFVDSSFFGVPGFSRQDLNTRDTASYLLTADYFVDDFAGQHSFKIGVEHETNLAGRDFTWKDIWFVQDYQDGSYDGLQAGDVRQDFGDRVTLARVNRYGGFVQDTWNVNDRLTLNLGVRVDDNSIKADDDTLNQISDEEVLGFTDWAPRFGFAYDLFGDGKTVLRGFFGRFYEDVTSGNTESLLAEVDPTVIYVHDGTDWVFNQAFGGSGNYSVDPDINNQYTQGLMIGIEQQLTEDIAGAVSFIYKKDEDIIGVISPNAAWNEQNISFSNENGSYSGVWYQMYRGGAATVLTNPSSDDRGVLEDLERNYYGVVAEVNKRMADNWSLKANYTYSRNTGTAGQGFGVIQGFTNYSNPNTWINSDGRAPLERPHVVKISGTYIAPFDFFISPTFNWQSGYPLTRLLFISDPGSNQTILIEPQGGPDGDDRLDSQMNVNLRVEKAFTIMDRYRAGIIFDVFNMFNDDTVTGVASNIIQSSAFRRPSAIVGPRFYQVGLRLIF